MKAEQLDAWRDTRKHGAFKFVLIKGVLGWGLPMLLLMALIKQPFADGIFSKTAMVHFVVWPLGGLIVGTLMWGITEHRFRKALASNKAAK